MALQETHTYHLEQIGVKADHLIDYLGKFCKILKHSRDFNANIGEHGQQLWQAIEAAEHVLPRLRNAAIMPVVSHVGSAAAA